MFEKELKELCLLLNKHAVQFMLIGGYAVNFHGFQRATVDLDIWYNPTKENLDKLLKAIEDFGFEIPSELNFSSLESAFIRLPLGEIKIELISQIDGKFSFSEAFASCETTSVGGVPINVMGYEYLIQNKIMSRRPKDLLDIQELERRRKMGK